ncbi:hypothetical protein [Fontivita pretiosa]|uniref:hypothetical protein n=1 Tax=Fontivita pretiosa TaxID=2989684 RepID=UPI003D171DC5
MQTFISAVFMVCVLAAALALTSAPAAGCGEPTPCELLTVESGAWFVRVRPDGSGVYGYGSGGAYGRSVRSGTFDFARLVSALSDNITSTRTDRYKYPVRFENEASASAPIKYTDDEHIVRCIFDAAFAANSDDLMQKLRAKHPPLP